MGSSQSKFLSNPEKFATRVGQDQASTKLKKYDFVIVGGGTAGCVLASRLSENREFTVLLIEAGKSHEGYLFSKIPIGFSKLLLSAADWAFTTSPQEHLDNRVISCPRGKLLGGSSSINALVYHHASPSDYDEWEREGADGWSYNALRPYDHSTQLQSIFSNVDDRYFLKAELFTPTATHPNIRADEHGTSGPWKIKGPDSSPIGQILVESCANVGIPTSTDFNTPRGTIGAATWTSFIDNRGHRSSAATAYLTNDVLARPNLTVAVNCCVEKILFDNENGTPRAIGVEIRTTRNGSLFRVSARKEVILSGGAYGTPHLLLVSGIGPLKELKEKGITVIKDLPAVGKNLVDHTACGSLVYRTNGVSTYDYLNKPLNALFALVQWYMTGKGPMATLASPGGAFVRSDDPSLPYDTSGSAGKPTPDLMDLTSGPTSPDLEIAWFPMIILNGGGDIPPAGLQGITLSILLLRPKSSGEITLKTNDIWDKPIVNPRWFSDEHDMHVMVRGVRLLLKLARTKPIANFTDLRKDKRYPFFGLSTANPDTVTDEEIQTFIRKNSSPAWHPACTARMGNSEDSSVVNPKLQVHGIQSLRIVDASIFPKQISGHPCAPVIAIAEKASDMIKEACSR